MNQQEIDKINSEVEELKRQRAEKFEAKKKAASGEADYFSRHIYEQVVIIRKWITFFGILVIIALVVWVSIGIFYGLELIYTTP